jgi:NAD(P)-dependent dehydrogenase (short-subunit alcohol dehydrogenase family)
MTNELKEKVAFITGAAHGQGRATAIALAKEGVHIAAFDIAQTLTYPGYELGSENELDSLIQECQSIGVTCLAFTGDVRVADDIDQAVSKTLNRFGRIDILFNNAGICAYGSAHELTEKEWDIMLDINLKGAWLVARRIIPVLIQQKSVSLLITHP